MMLNLKQCGITVAAGVAAYTGLMMGGCKESDSRDDFFSEHRCKILSEFCNYKLYYFFMIAFLLFLHIWNNYNTFWDNCFLMIASKHISTHLEQNFFGQHETG